MFLQTVAASGLLLASLSFGAVCDSPESIQDIVVCQNRVFQTTSSQTPQVSDLLSSLAAYSAVACTRSQASAQPADPRQGDLRCFMVFSSEVTLSVNLVEGLNLNHVEVSQPYLEADQQGVVLGYFTMDSKAQLDRVLDASIRPIGSTRMTCASCHRPQGREQVHIPGGLGWPMKAIPINSTVHGGVSRNGQIPPDQLGIELAGLFQRHQCTLEAPSETCLRIKAMLAAPSKLPLDNP